MRAAFTLVGPMTAYGLVTAVATTVVDQAVKYWLLFRFDLAAKGRVHLAPFIDLVMTWNTGISYGLFKQDAAFGRWILQAIAIALTVVLWTWLARANTRHMAVSLGLIIGGAVGNVIDRFAYGAVADFILFHVSGRDWSFNWYVFNLADAAIVAGVASLLYGFIGSGGAAKE
jgi:signal peptidase II